MPERRPERVRDEDVALPGHDQVVEEPARPRVERGDEGPGREVVDQDLPGRAARDVEPAAPHLQPDRGLPRAARDELRHRRAAGRAAVDRPVSRRAHEEGAAVVEGRDALGVPVRGRDEREDGRRLRRTLVLALAVVGDRSRAGNGEGDGKHRREQSHTLPHVLPPLCRA